MTLDEAIDIVVTGTGHHAYRVLCAEDYHDLEARDAYRALMIRLAGGEIERAAEVVRDMPPDSTLGIPTGPGRCCG